MAIYNNAGSVEIKRVHKLMKDHRTRTVCHSFKVVGPFDTASRSVTIQMKAIEQYFPVVLFIMLYKVVLTFKSVDEILKCDHSNESY